MNDIKLLVCCHRREELPKHELLVPIQVGTALASEPFEGYLHDNTGENISEKNKRYCELTALYWAWKNLQADYYGLFHYRRFLYPDTGARLPYRVVDNAAPQLSGQLGYADFSRLIREYDLILPLRENMHVSVREHYADAPFHHEKDLRLIEEIVSRRHPEMVPAMEEYLSSTEHYFGNICIMKRELFYDYCTWLFQILEEFDRKADTTGYSAQELRVNGYLAEPLLGIYATYISADRRILELPRLHLMPEQSLVSKSFLRMFPPSSYRRYLLKKIYRTINLGRKL